MEQISKLIEHCFNKYVYSSYLTCTRVAPNIPYMPNLSKPNALYYIILFLIVLVLVICFLLL
jgi:hypothetical protein